LGERVGRGEGLAKGGGGAESKKIKGEAKAKPF